MEIDSSQTELKSPSAAALRKRKLFVVSGVALAVITLAAAFLLLNACGRKSNPAGKPGETYAAELVSATGTVFVGKPGGIQWNQAAVGAHLMEGDRIQTADLGGASIRYANGATVSIQASTIFTVRGSGDGSMEISVPYMEDASSGAALNSSGKPPAAGIEDPAKVGRSNPFIRLDRMIRFGRSLELIGSVEAGSRLTVNNESVDVAGDGSFKHFTNPFPPNAASVRLVLKVTNLAGRSRTVTTSYDFDLRGGE